MKYIIFICLFLLFFMPVDPVQFGLPKTAHELIWKRRPGKYTFWLGGSKFAQVIMHDPTVGPNSPSSAADAAGCSGTITWTNPTNVEAQDNVYATAVGIASIATSHYLQASNYGFSIPAGSTINGITASIWKWCNDTGTGNCLDTNVLLMKAGTPSGTNHNDGNCWNTTNTNDVYGGSSDLWGLALSPSDVNNSGFGIALCAQTDVPTTSCP